MVKSSTIQKSCPVLRVLDQMVNPRQALNLTGFEQLIDNKKLYRAFSRQANGLTLNISVFLLRVNGKAEKDA